MAMAPSNQANHGQPQAGGRIGIRRRFTSPGRHPYDQVAWERRDSRITNYRDGAVAFEQRDVEVPVAWSINATNILAQKYFRGIPGTPERETSLRQVADRVVDTITGWGVKDGYFADADEASAFADELKYLIVTQRAAFNSPVWFNIGAKGRKQQASACFILSVDDTMDSILNWYVEEGTIFKGGSGAGVNLSRIRSSKEHLKGGGTASGPVSFMRGADASAGTIKCLHAETPIVTDGGVVPIREARVGSRVLTRFGFQPIEAVHDNGVRPVVKVRTSLGDELICTPEHRFRVVGRAGECWREAGSLSTDDHLLIDLDSARHGLLPSLEPVRTGHHNEVPHRLPPRLDEGFAMWLGWVYGDGSVTSRPGAKFVAIQIGDQDSQLVSRYQALTRSVFGEGVHFFLDRHADKPDASTSVRFSSSQVIRFLERNGLRKPKALELGVPPLVQQAPGTVRAAFLAGLFEADGCVTNGYPGLSTVSPDLAHDVHRLLLSIGIPSSIRRCDVRGGAYGSRPMYGVRVVGGEGVRRFAKLVGFVSDRKHQLLEAAVERKGRSPFESQWSLPHAETQLRGVWESTSDQRLRRAIAPYCRYRKPRTMSLLRARALLDRFPAELTGTSLARFAMGDELYVTATVEPAGEAPTFDLTVSGVNEYLVNNLVTHNSGGATRRAAKMVILNADHPDVEDFISCKVIEERKARVLREAGFDMDLDGKDSHSTQYQNANNSVRVTDEFMQAVVDDADWHLRAVTTGEVARTVKARDLMRQISAATWECADPGMQFDTTINRWHTAATTGRINGSNPCFPGDARVHTDKGLVCFEELFDRVRGGEAFGVYTHDATNPDAPAHRLEITSPEAFMITGRNEIVRLRFDNGVELRCTPGHRIFTTNRGYVEARQLTSSDEVKVLDLPAPAVHADARLPVSSDARHYATKGDWSRSLRLPEKWSPELGHYLGWLVGDGCIAGNVVTTIYGGGDDQEHVLPRHLELLGWMNGDRPPTPSLQANGTLQLRQSRRVLARYFEALGITSAKAPDKRVPWSVEQAPPDASAAFLQGLFDADGCVYDGEHSRYVGLGSASKGLLQDVQRLLSTFGIFSRIYHTQTADKHVLSHVRKDGTEATYTSGPMYDLRIANRSINAFADRVGFSLAVKAAKLQRLVDTHAFNCGRETVRLVDRVDDGVELTYNLTEPRNHSFVVDCIVIRNCAEYMHLDNSACNLASINLLAFLDEEENRFDVEGYQHAVEVVFTAQEILVGNADYPTESIAETSRRFRQLGLGYANLGALLMALGLPYDSDQGRAWAGALTAVMTGHAYATSARTAARMGPFAGYTENEEHMLRVLRMHRDELRHLDEALLPAELLAAGKADWDDAVAWGEAFGVRNSQASVLAPTGTIGLLMDCDTTGVEPDLGLCKMKKLVGGGTMTIVNQTVPRALRRLGYTGDQVDAIVSYVDGNKSILGAPHLAAGHVPVFACSMGDNAIHYQGHIRMMGAVQRWISGAISKTVNMPEEVSVEEVEQLHIDAWRLGIKAVAIYRDNCKVAQPLSMAKKEIKPEELAAVLEAAVEVAPPQVIERIVEKVVMHPVRQKLPRNRRSRTFEFRVADCKGFVTVGEYDDGRPGELFLRVSKQGSTLAGIMDAFAISVSHGLQYGVPLKAFIEAFTNMRFEPAGMTDDADIRFASSLLDYIFRRLAVDYLPLDERMELGILSVGERHSPTLPGIEEATTETTAGLDLIPSPPAGPTTAADLDPMAPTVALARTGASTRPANRDAPYCMQCGVQMIRAGSCHACPSCGSTSGCS